MFSLVKKRNTTTKRKNCAHFPLCKKPEFQIKMKLQVQNQNPGLHIHMLDYKPHRLILGKQRKGLLMKMLKTRVYSHVNFGHFVVQMEHWQLLFQQPQSHFWNRFEVLIHSTITLSTYYVSDTTRSAKQAKWDDFLISQDFRSLKQCFSNYFYESVPSSDKHH